jgi:hypothetical protein
MKTLLTILILGISTIIHGQIQIKPTNFNDCKVDHMFVVADTVPTWNYNTIGMVDYMNKYFDDKNLKKVENGMIMIGILILPDGKTCCYTFGNLTKVELNAGKIKEVINNMPNWTPAIQNGQKVTFLKNEIFKIKNGKFILD